MGYCQELGRSSLISCGCGGWQSAGGHDGEGFRAAGEEKGQGSQSDPPGQRGQVQGKEQALDGARLPAYCCVTLGKLVASSGLQRPWCEQEDGTRESKVLQAVTGSTHLLSPETIQAFPYREWE